MINIPNTGTQSGLTWGSALWKLDGYIYIMGQKGSQSVLSRILESDVVSQSWSSMQYWAYPDLQTLIPAWVTGGLNPNALNLTMLIGLPGTSEATMFYHPELQMWYTLQISMERYAVELYTANNFTGPWNMQDIYSIPSPWNNQPVNKDFVVYAPKAHPELAKQNEIVFTYNINTWDGQWKQLTAEYDQFYIPQFVKTTIFA